jgi:hypothetical protein
MMTLKDGKFYKDGNPYPLEFGNKEQIALIDKIQALQSSDGVALRVHESHLDDAPFYTSYVCVCGHCNKKYWSEEQLDNLSFKFNCGKCQLNYSLNESDFSEYIFILKLSK